MSRMVSSKFFNVYLYLNFDRDSQHIIVHLMIYLLRLFQSKKRLELPSIANKMSFETHNLFKLYMKAFSTQHWIETCVDSTSSKSNLNRFILNCGSKKTKCGFELEVVFDEITKKWKVEKEKSHTGGCLDRLELRMDELDDNYEVFVRQNNLDQADEEEGEREQPLAKRLKSSSNQVIRGGTSKRGERKRKVEIKSDETSLKGKGKKVRRRLVETEEVEIEREGIEREEVVNNVIQEDEEDDIILLPRAVKKEVIIVVEDSKSPDLDIKSSICTPYTTDRDSPFTPTPAHDRSEPLQVGDKLSIIQVGNFLHSLSPTLYQYASLLHSLGMSNKTFLLNLMCMSEERVDQLMKITKESSVNNDNNMKDFQRVLFKILIMKAQKKLQEEMDMEKREENGDW